MARGRPKGSVNKKSLQAFRVMADLKCNPIESLAHIANGNDAALGWAKGTITPELRMQANKALMPYRWPQLKALEVSIVNPGPPFQINVVQRTKPPVTIDNVPSEVVENEVDGYESPQRQIEQKFPGHNRQPYVKP